MHAMVCGPSSWVEGLTINALLPGPAVGVRDSQFKALVELLQLGLGTHNPRFDVPS